jgi:hypothetical protein
MSSTGFIFRTAARSFDLPDGQTVATTLMGREGALASLSVLGPARSSVTAIARVAGTASLISAAKFRGTYARSAAIRHVVQVHARSLPHRKAAVMRDMDASAAASEHQVRCTQPATRPDR